MMSLWPCFKSPEMESRSAPVSNEVSWPETSTSETIPAWRIRIEKFAVVTVHALSAGDTILLATCGIREAGGNIPRKRMFVEKCVGSATTIAARQISTDASRCGVRAASFPRGRRERFQDRMRDISGARRWWDEIATRAQPGKQAEGLAAIRRRGNSRNERSLRYANGAECAANSRRPARANGCARWLSIR